MESAGVSLGLVMSTGREEIGLLDDGEAIVADGGGWGERDECGGAAFMTRRTPAPERRIGADAFDGRFEAS